MFEHLKRMVFNPDCVLYAYFVLNILSLEAICSELGNFTYEYRLVNGKSSFEGRFEIRRNNGSWGTVAGLWSTRHASIACRSMGFSSSALSPDRSTTAFGRGTGPVHLYVGTCYGHESSLLHCIHSDWDTVGWWSDHFIDIGLYCLPSSQSLRLRLQPIFGISDNTTGLIQVFDGLSKWGYICDHIRTSYSTADIACRHLGFSSVVRKISSRPEDINPEYFIKMVNCNPDPHRSVFSLELGTNCPALGWDHANRHCDSGVAFGVACIDGELSQNKYDLRLADSDSYLSGIPQIKMEGEDTWRTVCFDNEILFGIKHQATWICSHLTNTVKHASAWIVSNRCDTDEIKHPQNMSVALLGMTYTEEDSPNVQVAEGTCSRYGYSEIFVSCTKEIKHYGLNITITHDQSCDGRCGYGNRMKSCYCDPECQRFNDCCPDYYNECIMKETLSLSSRLSYNTSLFTCEHLEFLRLNPVFLVGKCPKDWTNVALRERCEDHGYIPIDHVHVTLNDFIEKSAFVTMPVYDLWGNNYKNIYCVLCNGYSMFDTDHWGEEISLAEDINENHACPTETYQINFGERLRFCQNTLLSTQVVSTCQNNSNNGFTSSSCESYSAKVCSNSGVNNQKVYKNMHCAVCNGVSPDEVHPCLNQDVVEEHWDYHKSLWTFKTSRSDHSTNSTKECTVNGHIFDSHLRVCHNMSCHERSLEETKQGCYSEVHQKKGGSINGLCCLAQQSVIILKTLGDTTSDKTISCFQTLLNLTMEGTWETKRLDGVFFMYIELKNVDSVCNLAAKLDSTLLQEHSVVQNSDSCKIDGINYMYACDRYPMQDKCEGPSWNWYNGTTSDFIPMYILQPADVLVYQENFIIPKFVLHEVSYTRNEGRYMAKEDRVYVCGLEIDIPACPLVEYYSDYKIIQNQDDSRNILIGKNNISSNKFVIFPDGRILVCKSTFLEPDFLTYYDVLEYVNIAGVAVSMLSLAVNVVLQIRFSDVHNFHIGSIISICISLFFAQGLPILGSRVSFRHSICFAIAVTTHYAWLFTFTWMTIIGINIFNTYSTNKLQTREVRESSLLIKFLLPIIGWCLPLTIVIVCISLHFINSDTYVLRYGTSSPCWISDTTANFFAFGIPVLISLTINIALFISVSILSCFKKYRSSQLQNKKGNVIEYSDVIGCLKIGIWLGIGWVFAFIASSADIKALWWIFVIINSMQGPLLLVSNCWSKQFRQQMARRDKGLVKNTVPLEMRGDSTPGRTC